MSEQITIRLNRPQLAAIRSPRKKRIMVAGIGAGKSIVGGIYSKRCSEVVGARGLVLASTYDQLRDATLPRMQEAWAMMGIYEEDHYVIGKRPPHGWGVEPYSSLNNANVVTFYCGSYIKLGSAEKYNAHRGPAYDWIWGDEVRDWREPIAAVNVLVGRLRGRAYMELGLVSPMLLTTSPFDDPAILATLYSGEDVEVIRGTTFDNLRNLPADYVDTQRSTLDDLTYRREVLGEDVEMAGLRACWAFNAECYPAGNVIRQPFDPARDLTLCWDFNSSATRPMSTIGYQPFVIDGILRDVVTCEWVNLRTQTPTQCELVYDDLVTWGFRGRMITRGDQTGEYANRGSSATQSDYAWIERMFKTGPRPTPEDPGLWTYMPKEPFPRTRRERNRWEALNGRFCTAEGTRYMLIADHCTVTIEAATKLKLDESGQHAESNAYNDPMAALSYGPYMDHPVHRPEAKSYTS